MEVLTALITGIVLTSLSALTALAVKHPRAFERLYPFLNVAVSIAFLSLTIWQAAVHVTWTGIEPFVAREQLHTAYLVRSSIVLPYLWICAAFTALLVFFWINMKLARSISNSNARGGGGDADPG